MVDRKFIPFSSPSITEREIENVVSVLRGGRIASTEENLLSVKRELKAFTAGHEVLLTTSCTSAMELGLGSFDLTKQDRVIVPSFTFVSTANAILAAGGTPVFVDIEEETLNLDLNQVEACAQGARGVMPVHYASISCDMDRLLKIAAAQNLFILEDAAHAVGALYKNRYLGTLGDFGAFSFHDTKNYVAGEGGALVINNLQLRERVMCMYDKGTNRQQFLRGEIDKYTWVSKGSSYAMSAILAAVLEVQLQRFEEIRSARAMLCKRYQEGLQRLVDEGHLRFTDIPSYAVSNYHKAFFLLKDALQRNALLAHLKARAIGAVFHYIPLHLSPYALTNLGTRLGQFPVAERVAASIVRLPLFPRLQLDYCDEIIEEVTRFFHPEISSSIQQNSSKDSPEQLRANTLDLSLIIPCYNEAPHLQKNLNAILEILDRMQLRYEIILIDDCSKDATAERIREYKILRPNHNIRSVFHAENHGRGATVTEGIHIAYGRIVGFIDIDLEISASYIPSAVLPLLEGKADIAIAERFYRFQLSATKRYLMSKGYRWLVRRFLHTPSLDTESGFKFFRRDMILPILSIVIDKHWFWDTEVSIRALDAGLRIFNVPVLFQRQMNKMSTVRALSDSARSFLALSRFRKIRTQKSSQHSL